MAVNRMMRTLEVELNKSPYKNLAVVNEALLYWNGDHSGVYGYAKALRTQGRKAMMELVEFMGSLPGRYYYSSVDEYVLGYSPSGGELSGEEAQDLKQWNVILRQALRMSNPSDGFDELSRQAAQVLLEDVCEFSVGRHERAMRTLPARLKSKGKGLQNESVPFLEIGQGSEREALVEVVGPTL